MFRMNFTAPKQNIAPAIPNSQLSSSLVVIQNPPSSYVKFQYNMLNLFKSEGCGSCGK